jgi:hypothetical protein
MKQQAGSGEIVVDQSTKDALSRGEAHLWLNDKQLSREQLRKPIELPAGNNNIQIGKGSELKPPDVIVSDKDDPTLLERTAQGNFVYTPLQRRVAEAVLAQGGKVKLKGAEASITRATDLPKGRLHLEAIDLGGVTSFGSDEVDLIKKLQGSLKQVILPKRGISQTQIDELRRALPDCEIKRGAAAP